MAPLWRFQEFLQPFIRLLPLTALINALRASQWGEVLTLALWGGMSFALALRFFRWK